VCVCVSVLGAPLREASDLVYKLLSTTLMRGEPSGEKPPGERKPVVQGKFSEEENRRLEGSVSSMVDLRSESSESERSDILDRLRLSRSEEKKDKVESSVMSESDEQDKSLSSASLKVDVSEMKEAWVKKGWCIGAGSFWGS